MKVKAISLPYIFQVMYVLCITRPRYQVSVYRTIGPLVMPPTLKKLMGHIAFGACVGAWVRAWVGAWVTLFVPTVTFKPLKLES